MPRHRVAATAEYSAPAGYIYAIIADYLHGHPRILPERYFREFHVERGGVGAGTIIRFAMPVLGRLNWCRAAITEPEPGRVLLERDLDRGTLTTFTVEPTVTGGCSVTITTDLNVRSGLAGRIERSFAEAFLRRVYREELALLRSVASEPARDDGWSLPMAGVRIASELRHADPAFEVPGVASSPSFS